MFKTTSIFSTWNGLQPKELSGLQDDGLNISLNKDLVAVLYNEWMNSTLGLFSNISKSLGTNLA
jgi:hypothetical protein